MITSWSYENHCNGHRDNIKQLIKDNNLRGIDVGASAYYWSYPEIKHVIDSIDTYQQKTDVSYFKINLEDTNQYEKILNYVDNNGLFDYSVCTHVIEDLFNPLDALNLLPKISKKGFIAVPSKYDEFLYLFENKFLGNAHHKQILDIRDNKIIFYPKFSFIEIDKRSEILRKTNPGRELCIYWENDIPFEIFGNGIPFIGDNTLINAFYNQLLYNVDLG